MDVAVGLRVRGLDHLVHVDAGALGEDRELVGEPDVDVAVRRLGELGHLGGLGRAEVPDAVAAREVRALVELEDGLVEVAGALGAGRGEPADQLGVLAQVGEDPPGEHPLGREDDVEVGALDQPAAGLERRLPAGPGGADRQRRLVDDERAGGQVGRDVLGGRVHPAEVGLPVAVDEERHDDHDDVRRPGRRRRSPSSRVSCPAGTSSARCSARWASPGNGSRPALTVATVSALMSTPMTVWPRDGELRGQRETDLAQADDGDLHRPGSSSPSSTVRPSRAARMQASATRTVARPSRMVTISSDLPSTASRKRSCWTRSGSGLGMA